MHNVKLQAGTNDHNGTDVGVTSSSQTIAKPLVIRRFSTALVWYHRSEEMPHIGNRILVMSPCYDERDPMKIRLIDSQFYKMSVDAEWWAYVNVPPSNGEVETLNYKTKNYGCY